MSMHSALNLRPLPRQIDGEWFMPLSYVDILEEQMREQMRGKSEHRGYMAEIKNLWDNIPENLSGMSYAKSADTFRKYALIKTGWCTSDDIVFETQEMAVRAVSTIRYMARMGHGYAITIVSGNIVQCTTPVSQSFAEMDRDDFKASKADVLDYCRGIVGDTA